MFNFIFIHIRKRGLKKSKRVESIPRLSIQFLGELPAVKTSFSFVLDLKKALYMAWTYAFPIIRHPAFLIITALGVRQAYRNFVVNAGPNGSNVYPFTSFYLDRVDDIFFYMIPITIIFGGILIWRERDHKSHELFDSLPLRPWTGFVSKFVALAMIQLVYVLAAFVVGVLSQILIFNFTDIEPMLYIQRLFGIEYINYLHMAVMVILIQTLSPNKYLGFFFSALYYILSGVFISAFGLAPIFNYGFLPSFIYSNINGFGSAVSMLVWYRLFWILFAVLLVVLTSMMWRQNIETSFKHRLAIAKQRMTKQVRMVIGVTVVLWICVGAFILYNQHVLNVNNSQDQQLSERAEYEKRYQVYDQRLKPVLTHMDIQMDFYPNERKVNLKGRYLLKNESSEAIDEITYSFTNKRVTTLNHLDLSRNNISKVADVERGFYVHALNQPLHPNDTISLIFDLVFDADGFSTNNAKQELATNGTYIYSSSFYAPNYFPHVGYNRFLEITTNATRADYGLHEKSMLPPPTDEKIRTRHGVDYMTLNAVLSTVSDQTAITNGDLKTSWTTNNRNYFHYQSDMLMANSLAFISGEFERISDRVGDVDIELYYDAKHAYNIDRMMKGMKKSLLYSEANFTPYPFKNLRIVEATIHGYPGRGTASSLPSMFTWQEFGGFISNLEDTSMIDVVFNTTTHEMAHQWWGNMMQPAFAEGVGVLSETLSQWVRLKLMEAEYGKSKTEQFLELEMNSYLRARQRDLQGERPMATNLNQAYLNYRKGSIVMYTLGKYIGEDAVNRALKRLADDYSNQMKNFPTTVELLNYFRDETPDSMQYLITDLFETITLHDNQMISATFSEDDDSYLLQLEMSSKKFRSDSIGNQTEIAVNDLIPVVVFGENEKIIYDKLHRFDDTKKTIKLKLEEKPESAGIDPFLRLIDRKREDNRMTVEKVE